VLSGIGLERHVAENMGPYYASAVCATPRSLIARRVGHLVTGLLASKDYVRRHGRPGKLSELAEHKCVLFRSQNGKDTWRFRDGDREVSVEVAGSIDVDEISSLHQAIVAGMGIGQVSFFSSARITTWSATCRSTYPVTYPSASSHRASAWSRIESFSFVSSRPPSFPPCDGTADERAAWPWANVIRAAKRGIITVYTARRRFEPARSIVR
jgi:hypothetical protein